MGHRKMEQTTSPLMIALSLFIAGAVGSFVVTSLIAPMTHAEEPGQAPAETTGLKADIPRAEAIEQSLTRREKELDQRAVDLEAMAVRLKAQEQELEKKIQRYSEMQKNLDQLYQKSAAREDEIFKKLIQTIEKMPAKKASAMVAEMNDRLAVDVILALKEKTAGALLAAMETPRAKELSTAMASRKPASTFSNQTSPNPGASEVR